MESRMRCLVVDDHPLVREAIVQVLQGLRAGACIESAADFEQALSLAAQAPEPELLLLDLQLPGLSGLQALHTWRQRFPAVAVVVVSADRSPATVQQALAAGAAGFVPKSTPLPLLRGALRLVLDGGRYLPPELLQAAPEPAPAGSAAAPAVAGAPALTPRQRQVLRLLGTGAPNKGIARTLGLAERTVKAHVTALMRQYGARSRTELALRAGTPGRADG